MTSYQSALSYTIFGIFDNKEYLDLENLSDWKLHHSIHHIQVPTGITKQLWPYLVWFSRCLTRNNGMPLTSGLRVFQGL